MARSIGGLFLVVAAVVVLTMPVRASDPVGVYCLIERVVFEPADQPDRAQVWGACAMANAENRDYDPPRKGYLYYSIKPGQETLVRREWADLKRVAGTNDAVGFGGRYASNGRIRPASEAPASPDVYPVNIGVTRLTGSYWQGPDLLAALTRALGRGR